VLDFEPQTVTIELDRVAQKTVPVEVERGDVPVNMSVGPVTVDPVQVRVVGPASVLARVVAAQATVIVQPSGIDVDQDVELVPIDDVGDAVAQVRLEPATARVTIPIFSDRETRQLPVRPQITGSPAAGFELIAPTVEPRFITVEGDADELAALTTVDTQPIPVTGFSTSRTLEVGLALPTGVVALDAQEVTVTIGVRAVTGTLSYKVGVDRVLITVGGTTPDLDRLIGATLAVDLDVTTLGPGTTDVPVSAALPAGVSLVSASPPRVQVVVTARPSPPPS
jgi:YbbR domain-containing protein